MYDIVLCVYERFRVDGLKRYVNDDRFRVDGDKNMRLLAFAFTIVFVWTGPYITNTFHSTIENFSACCNTSRGIKLGASQADRIRSACSLAKSM